MDRRTGAAVAPCGRRRNCRTGLLHSSSSSSSSSVQSINSGLFDRFRLQFTGCFFLYVLMASNGKKNNDLLFNAIDIFNSSLVG